MATPTVTVIHATPAAMPPVAEALRILTGVRVLNQLDEALLAEIERRGGLTTECVERMATHLRLAAAADSDVVLTTCNAYSLVVMRDLRPRFPELSVIIVDEPMIRAAVQYDRIAVLATVSAGLDSQRELVTAVAQDEDRTISVVEALVPAAFTALAGGDPAEHDRLVLAKLDQLIDQADVIVLAQASIARVLPLVPPRYAARVLSSPASAAREVAALLGRAESRSAEPRRYGALLDEFKR